MPIAEVCQNCTGGSGKPCGSGRKRGPTSLIKILSSSHMYNQLLHVRTLCSVNEKNPASIRSVEAGRALLREFSIQRTNCLNMSKIFEHEKHNSTKLFLQYQSWWTHSKSHKNKWPVFHNFSKPNLLTLMYLPTYTSCWLLP